MVKNILIVLWCWGYAKAILGRANCFVKALDQDPTVLNMQKN